MKNIIDVLQLKHIPMESPSQDNSQTDHQQTISSPISSSSSPSLLTVGDIFHLIEIYHPSRFRVRSVSQLFQSVISGEDESLDEENGNTVDGNTVDGNTVDNMNDNNASTLAKQAVEDSIKALARAKETKPNQNDMSSKDDSSLLEEEEEAEKALAIKLVQNAEATDAAALLAQAEEEEEDERKAIEASEIARAYEEHLLEQEELRNRMRKSSLDNHTGDDNEKVDELEDDIEDYDSEEERINRER